MWWSKEKFALSNADVRDAAEWLTARGYYASENEAAYAFYALYLQFPLRAKDILARVRESHVVIRDYAVFPRKTYCTSQVEYSPY